MEILYRLNPIEINCEASLKDIEDEFPITGYFQLNFGDNHYGYYHNNPLRAGEEGLYSISNWFYALALCMQALKTNSFVALNDVKTLSNWILFEEHDEDTLHVSLIKARKEIGVGYTLTERFEFEYAEWRNVPLSRMSFSTELLRKSTDYINELTSIDSRFLQTKQMKFLISTLNID